MTSSDWYIVLHGGCADTCPDLERQRNAEESLRRVANVAAVSIKAGARATDVVAQIVTALEDCPHFNAGKGSVFTQAGTHELEAGIVDGHSGAYGAVACIFLVAKALLENGAHCMLVGPAADDMSNKFKLDTVTNDYFTTEFRRMHVSHNNDDSIDNDHGTVGAVVLDRHGQLAAGGSTGGTNGKPEGRIGDTAVLGAGLYADSNVAVVCSGAGDQIFRQLVATKLANYHSSGLSLIAAARRAVLDMSQSGKTCAVLAMSKRGDIAIESTARVFYVASGSRKSPPEAYLRSTTVPLFTQHIIYQDPQITAGLTRYPSTPGHTLVVVRNPADMFSLDPDGFTRCMLAVSRVAGVLRAFYRVARCALVTDGSNSLSIIPLHGLNEVWEPVTSDSKEFHEKFPGYISSKDGPKMDDSRLGEVCSRIQNISGASAPFNHRFNGDSSDENLFARIIRGELPQYRVWEDDEHVAFLTPFANAPGFTVLVPRAHLSSDIFSLDVDAYSSLVHAAYTVAQILKKAFGLRRCGMIFEGFEIDYAHVKLIPIHEVESDLGSQPESSPMKVTSCEEKYPGFVTSLSGPLVKDMIALSRDAPQLRALHQAIRITPPGTWKSPADHCSTVLTDSWYANLLILQDTLFHKSIDFFKKRLRYKYALVPATTDAISSPMGLGSDSEPVPVSLLGQDTHLADSMQFALEYFLRIEDGLPGTYYVGCSFRGEDPDAMHLNQFYHVECELRGGFSAGISIVEEYLVELVSIILQEHRDIIRDAVGHTDHLDSFLKQYDAQGKFPQITLDEALALAGMDSSTWKYAVPSQPEKGRAITRAGELRLIKHFGGPVWLTEMDHLSVPFYQAYTDKTCTKGRCADLLLGNGEILGLGERHVRPKDVLGALRQHDVPLDPYAWYMEIRETKPIQTTGWGMGIERFLAWVLQHDDIRDLAIIPRMKGCRFAP